MSIEKPPAILCPPPFIKLFCVAEIIAEPISKPTVDLAELSNFIIIDIIITGLLNFSFNLDATNSIIPSCQLAPCNNYWIILEIFFF